MLLTEKNLSRRKNLVFPQPERWKKVKRSMAAIKVVLGERKREKIAAHQEKMMTEREAEE
jgi:ribosomal protein L29